MREVERAHARYARQVVAQFLPGLDRVTNDPWDCAPVLSILLDRLVSVRGLLRDLVEKVPDFAPVLEALADGFRLMKCEPSVPIACHFQPIHLEYLIALVYESCPRFRSERQPLSERLRRSRKAIHNLMQGELHERWRRLPAEERARHIVCACLSAHGVTRPSDFFDADRKSRKRSRKRPQLRPVPPVQDPPSGRS